MNKYVTMFIATIALLVCTMLIASHSNAAVGFSNMSSAGFRIINGGTSTVGGSITSTGNRVSVSNMNPYQQDLSKNDFKPYHDQAKLNLADGRTFRNSLALIGKGTASPTSGIGQLLTSPSDNYETVTGLLDGLSSVEAKLDNARIIFAYGAYLGYSDADSTAVNNLRDAVKTLASIYMMIADEFLSDALEFRFSWSPNATADARLQEQICLLGYGKAGKIPDPQCSTSKASHGAQHYYEKAIDTFMYGFLPATMGKSVYIASFFQAPESSLFNLAVERLAITIREKSAKQLVRMMYPGDSSSTTLAKQTAVDAVRSAGSSAYLMAVALSSTQGAQFEANGGNRLVNSLTELKSVSNKLRDNINPLGYDDSFIPMKEFDYFKASAQKSIGSANDLQAKLDAARAKVDADSAQLITALSNIALSDSTGGYQQQLSSMTGISLTDPAFITKAESAGDDLYDCDVKSETFSDCIATKTKGALGVKYNQIRLAQIQLDEKYLIKNNLMELLNVNQQAQLDSTRIENIYNTTYSETLKSYLAKLDNFCTIAETKSKEKNGKWGPPKIEKNCKIKNADGIEINKEIKLQEVLRDYRIAMLDSQYAVTFKDILNRIAEAQIAIDAAIQIRNSAVMDFENAMMEKDAVYYLYNKAKSNITNLNTYTIDKIWQEMPELRLLQTQEAIMLSQHMSSAVHSAYLGAKAIEYYYLSPIDNIHFLDGRILDITDIFKAQTPQDVSDFIDKLSDIDSCSWGTIRTVHIQVKFIRDILGIADNDPQRQAKIAAYFDRKVDKSDNSVELKFSTTLNDSYINKWNKFNLKIWQGPVPSPCTTPLDVPKGVSVYFNDPLEAVAPYITLTQKGHSTYLTKNKNIVEYTPISQWLNMDVMGSDDSLITFDSIPASTQTPVPVEYWTSAFTGRSVAASDWTLKIQDFSSDIAPGNKIHWNQVSEITINFDAIGQELPPQ